MRKQNLPARPRESPPRAAGPEPGMGGGRRGEGGCTWGLGGTAQGGGAPGAFPACSTSFKQPRCPPKLREGQGLARDDRAGCSSRARPAPSGNGVTTCLPPRVGSVTQVPARWQRQRLRVHSVRSVSQALSVCRALSWCFPGGLHTSLLPRSSPRGANRRKEEPPAEPLPRGAVWAAHLYSPGPAHRSTPLTRV